MFLHFFRFELRYWLRQPMVYIFIVAVGLLPFFAMASDNVQIGGGGTGIVFKNAALSIQNFYSILSIIALLMTTAFVVASTLRDLSTNAFQLIYTTPINRTEYLLGRLSGAIVISVLPLLGISLGVLLGAPFGLALGWVQPDRIGPVLFGAHLQSILTFAIPNTIFISAVIFAVAALTRSSITSFISALMLTVFYLIAIGMTSDMENQTLSALLDPFGTTTLDVITRYWTSAERNIQTVGYGGLFLINRLIWLAVSVAIIAFTCWKFSFTERNQKVAKGKAVAKDEVASYHI